MPDLIPIVQAYLAAGNSHNPDAALAFLTEDVVLEAVGRGQFRGREEARRAAAWDAALNSETKAFDLQQVGHRVVGRLEERNEWLRLVGIPHIEYHDCRFAFRGQRIHHIRTEMRGESREAMDTALKAVFTWAARERPVDLGRLLPSGHFRYGPRAARGWLALLASWQASGGHIPSNDG
jgi:hypothetical protein